MAEVFALLRPDGSLLFTSQKAGGWTVSEQQPDTGANGRKLCIFVPGEDVLGLEAILPSRSEREARKAAPFQIEDEVAEPVETLHVAVGENADPTVPRPVHAVSTAVMDEWLDLLAARGLAEASLVSAHSLLPAGDGLRVVKDMVFGRAGGRSFTLDLAMGTDVFLGLENGSALPIYGAGLAQRLGRSPAGNAITSDEVWLTQLASWATERPVLDLRQGDYSIRRSIELSGLKTWRRAGIILICGLMAWFGVVIAETFALNNRVEVLNAKIDEFAAAGWPEFGGDVEAVLSQTRAPGSASTAAMPSVLTVLAAVYGGLDAADGAELRSIRYDRRQRQMSARIAVLDYGDISPIVEAIEAAGLAVQAGDARQSGSMIVGELIVEPKP